MFHFTPLRFSFLFPKQVGQTRDVVGRGFHRLHIHVHDSLPFLCVIHNVTPKTLGAFCGVLIALA